MSSSTLGQQRTYLSWVFSNPITDSLFKPLQVLVEESLFFEEHSTEVASRIYAKDLGQNADVRKLYMKEGAILGVAMGSREVGQTSSNSEANLKNPESGQSAKSGGRTAVKLTISTT